MSSETTVPSCYRHADRQTRLSCSNCGRPVCIDCVRTAAVGQRCPECAGASGNQRVITGRELYGRGLRQTAPVTFGLMAVCVGVFVVGFLAPLVYAYGAQDNGLVAQGQWWRLATAAFLHSPSRLYHIGFNMYALYIFGPQLERQVGSAPFLSLYMGSAMAGGGAYYVYGVLTGSAGTALGASGAIFGLFGATLAAALRSRHTAAGQAGLRQLLILLGINLALPLIIPLIAWQAHLGGLVAGFAIAWTWGMVGRRAGGAAIRTAAGGTVALLSVLVVLSL